MPHSALLLESLSPDLLVRIIEQAFIVSITDAKGLIRYVNDTFCKVSQYDRSELIGKPHRIVKSDVHSRDFFKSMWDTIGRGESWHGEICNRKKSGDLYWVDSFILPIPGNTGAPAGYLSIRYEVTQLKEHEQTVQSQESLLIKKNRRLNNLAFWIAHDIRPPIANLIGLSEGMTDALKSGADGSQFVQRVNDEAVRADQILRQIMRTAIASDIVDEQDSEWLSGK